MNTNGEVLIPETNAQQVVSVTCVIVPPPSSERLNVMITETNPSLGDVLKYSQKKCNGSYIV